MPAAQNEMEGGMLLSLLSEREGKKKHIPVLILVVMPATPQ